MSDETSARVVDDDGVVRIGSVVFALIQPGAGHERAFNHWYERDHYYTAGTAAPGVFSAGRFVEPEAGTHLALYFVLPDHEEERIAFAMAQVGIAGAQDRMFDERDHLHTWSYRPVGVWRADPAGVPPALALDHRYAGVTVVMTDDALNGLVPALTDPSAAHDIDVVLTLAPVAPIMASAWAGDVDPDRRRVLVAFHRRDPGSGLAVLGGLAVGAGFGWARSFLPVVFGTDTHVPG